MLTRGRLFVEPGWLLTTGKSVQECWLSVTWTLGNRAVCGAPLHNQAGKGGLLGKCTLRLCVVTHKYTPTQTEQVPLRRVCCEGRAEGVDGRVSSLFLISSQLGRFSKAAYLEPKCRNTGGLMAGQVGKCPESCSWDMVRSVLAGLASRVRHLDVKDFRKGCLPYCCVFNWGFLL